MCNYFKENVPRGTLLLRTGNGGQEVYVSLYGGWYISKNQSIEELMPITEKEAKRIKPMAFV